MLQIALLRGINVNGHRMVPMPDLRAMCADLGHTDVRTYVNSGNVLFRGGTSPAESGRAIEAGIAARFGIADVAVLVLTAPELAGIAGGNPFVCGDVLPPGLFVTLLARPPQPERLDGIDAERLRPDRFAVAGRCVYVHCPAGYHRTRLTNGFFERRLGERATTRNWKTIVRLAGMAAG